jgi:hypothetical protein
MPMVNGEKFAYTKKGKAKAKDKKAERANKPRSKMKKMAMMKKTKNK